MAYKAVSCRFNLQDEEERKLYNMVEQKAKDYSTISGCIKPILRDYFAGKSSDIALLMEQNTQKILDFINEKAFVSDVSATIQKAELPDCVDLNVGYKYDLYDSVKEKLVQNGFCCAYEIMLHFNKIYPIRSLIDKDYFLNVCRRNGSINEIQGKEKYNAILLEMREKQLIPVKWMSEFELYLLVKSYFDDTVFQYRSSWLEYQSLDVYIPSIKTAIEYQGF